MSFRALLFTTILASAAQQPALARAAGASPVRMITTNTTESAPLNLVSRSFIRLEPAFADSIEAQRLTYLVRRASSDPSLLQQGLRSLLGHISSEGSAITIAAPETESQSHGQVESFLLAVNQDLAAAAAARPATVDAVERLKFALNSAITRQDMKVLSATVAEERLNTQHLILIDEETSDLLLLSLSRPAN